MLTGPTQTQGEGITQRPGYQEKNFWSHLNFDCQMQFQLHESSGQVFSNFFAQRCISDAWHIVSA